MSAAGEAQETLSLCSFRVGGRLFGIETPRIREVVGVAQVHRVPLAPPWIGGVVAYRGEVLTAVCLGALLGASAAQMGSTLLVLDGDASEPCFGLLVDGAGGVVSVRCDARSANPSTLDAAGREIFCAVFRTVEGLLVQLDPERLRPSHIAGRGCFAGKISVQGAMRCGL